MKNLTTFGDFPINENSTEGLYIIGFGLSGGFGGIRDYEVIQADSEHDASMEAWRRACDEYESYSGMHGLRSIQDIMEEDGIEDESEAEEIYNEEREGWLDYTSVPYSKEAEKKVKGYGYQNEYKDITG